VHNSPSSTDDSSVHNSPSSTNNSSSSMNDSSVHNSPHYTSSSLILNSTFSFGCKSIEILRSCKLL
jgi:hypothetical protein